jgi:hypothetical protein
MNYINYDNWTDLKFLDEKNKNLLNNYFKNKKGKFKINNNILIVDFENWGIEHFYMNEIEDKPFYNVYFENFRKIYNIAISFQIGSWITFKKMESYLENFNNINVNIYIILIEDIATEDNIEYLTKFNNITVLSGENRGMDIGLFLISLHYIKSKKYNHDYLFKIHTKTNDNFRNDTLNNMIGSHDKIINNIKNLSANNIGMISGNVIYRFKDNKDLFDSNMYHLDNLIQYIYNEKINKDYLEFPAATFFIANFKIFNILSIDKLRHLYFNLNNSETLDYYWYSIFYNININNKINIYRDYLRNNRFPNNVAYQIKTGKLGLRDCMIEHSFERLFGYMCRKAGLFIIR